jgi:Predicted transcriptional regulator with C-terminal CBS domains
MKRDNDSSNLQIPVHEKLKSRRESLGLTQQQVADIVSILVRQYQRFESGDRKLTSSTFRIGVAIADALEFDVHELVNTPSVNEYLKNKAAFEQLQAETEQEEK